VPWSQGAEVDEASVPGDGTRGVDGRKVECIVQISRYPVGKSDLSQGYGVCDYRLLGWLQGASVARKARESLQPVGLIIGGLPKL
jgi:hypothetical protein